MEEEGKHGRCVHTQAIVMQRKPDRELWSKVTLSLRSERNEMRSSQEERHEVWEKENNQEVEQEGVSLVGLQKNARPLQRAGQANAWVGGLLRM